jgi:hypothetical protein
VDTYIRDGCDGLDRCTRHPGRRSRHFSDVNVQLRYLRAAGRDRNSVSARIARLGPEPRVIAVLVARVVIAIDCY